MKMTEQLNAWLGQWSQQWGSTLALDASGQCAFAFDEMHFQLSLHDAEQSLLLAAELNGASIAERPDAMRALLDFAHLGGQSHRCGVSLAPQGEPVLWLWLETGTLDAASLSNGLTGFVTTAQAAREALAEHVGPITEGTTEPRLQPSDGQRIDMSALMLRV